MKIVVWELDDYVGYFLTKYALLHDYELVGCITMNPSFWNETLSTYNCAILPPNKLTSLSFDKIAVLTEDCEALKGTLMQLLKLPAEFFITRFDIEQEAIDKLEKQYQDSDDAEIQDIIKSYQHRGSVDVYGTFIPNEKPYHDVLRDEEDFPYIMFEGKRMYFPQTYNFDTYYGKEVVRNILMEQEEKSPHLYIRSPEDIPDQAVIVDAGVCEGNFALRYVDKAKKIYLIESDPDWIAALSRTFRDYADKVVLCDKFLSRFDTETEIRLDTLVQEPIDFLKMDIEGAEIDALIGAHHTLKNSHANCAICSYHRQYDAEYITMLLQSYGYETSFSDGYMAYIWEPHGAELRHGVVYGKKKSDMS